MHSLPENKDLRFLKNESRLYPLPHIEGYLLKKCRPSTAAEIVKTVASANDDEFVVLHYINRDNKKIGIQLSEQFAITPKASSLTLESHDEYGNTYYFLGMRVFSATLVRAPSGMNKRDLKKSLLRIRKNWSFSSGQMRQNVVPAAAISRTINRSASQLSTFAKS